MSLDPERCDWSGCEICETVDISQAFERGAAVAFGLMGMAEAIRNRPGVTDWMCRVCDSFNSAGSIDCDDCGAEWT